VTGSRCEIRFCFKFAPGETGGVPEDVGSLFPFSAGANPEDVAGCLCLDDEVEGEPCFVDDVDGCPCFVEDVLGWPWLAPVACSFCGLLARGGV
jgi:hypothetical protein